MTETAEERTTATSRRIEPFVASVWQAPLVDIFCRELRTLSALGGRGLGLLPDVQRAEADVLSDCRA